MFVGAVKIRGGWVLIKWFDVKILNIAGGGDEEVKR